MIPDAGNSALPHLREDLQILRSGLSYSGAPLWVVLDPLRNRFFSITYEMFQLLSLWNRNNTAPDLIAAVRQTYGRETDAGEIEAAVRLLDRSYFFHSPVSGDWRELHQRAQARHRWYMRILHNYLFFKIPLVRPEPFIRRAWPYVSFLFSRGFLIFCGLVALAGLFLVSRQWDAFIYSFPYIFSLEGIAVSILSIALIKSLHELGHAFVAHRFGCRVPTMGVAFMVLIPMLYTDVTDAWRLRSRGARFLIDAAGVLTELCIAALALLLWVFLPEGPLRSAVFVLATAGWVLSLIINLNPFTRFDGYYMLADLMGLENLQPRAFSHLRWRIRRLLFSLNHAPPEDFPPRLDAMVTVYAICTVIYRFFLYLGIALLVYHFTVKIIGVILFVVEIGFFIARPIWSELTQWWSMRNEIIRSRRTYVAAAILAAAILAFLLPISTSVRAPALVMPQSFLRIYPSEAGKIETINVSDERTVQPGEVLFVLSDPALVHEAETTRAEIALAERRLARIGVRPDDLAARGVIESERNSLAAKLRGLNERRNRLTVLAPFSGTIRDLNPEIHTGRWVSRKEPLALLVADAGIVARGYISDYDYARVAKGATGVFVPDDLTLPKVDAKLTSVAATAVDRLELPQLTSIHGGPIAATASQDGTLVPNRTQHTLVATLAAPTSDLTQATPGILILEGSPESFAARVWRQVLKVLIRETGG